MKNKLEYIKQIQGKHNKKYMTTRFCGCCSSRIPDLAIIKTEQYDFIYMVKGE